jgi:ATP-dependent protease ClpP protease subunit
MEREVKIKNFPNVRTIYIGTDINGDCLASFKKDLDNLIAADEDVYNDNLRALAEIDKSLVEAYKKNVKFPPIYIDISSGGGSVYHGFAIYDILSQVNGEGKHELIAKVSGYAASMATIIMLGCDKRLANANTRFMIHSVSSFMIGKVQDLEDDLEETKELTRMVKEIYTKKTKINAKKLDEIEKYKKDWWFSADEALELNLITDII